MITVNDGCPKCHAANTYYRYGASKQGKVLERTCHACGWCKPERIWVTLQPTKPYTSDEAEKIMAKIEAKALEVSERNVKGGEANIGRLREWHRVRGGMHKPYKSYKRRGGVIHDSDFEADPDTI